MSVELTTAPSTFSLTAVEDYGCFISDEAVDRIIKKAKRPGDLHIVHINSTY